MIIDQTHPDLQDKQRRWELAHAGLDWHNPLRGTPPPIQPGDGEWVFVIGDGKRQQPVLDYNALWWEGEAGL